MAAINGWRLILRDGSTITYCICPNGQIEHSPGRKFRLEKRNAYDPTIVHQRDAYREDTFELSCTLQPSEFAPLLDLLSGTGQHYVEYTTGGSTNVQYPVSPVTLPKCPDDLHEYPEKVKFTMVSRFIGKPGYIDFSHIITQVDDETVIVVNPD
jgi:hypothetical protein